MIPASIYEDRKDQFGKRIEAMIEYASHNDMCRSRMLLRYFGEQRSADCDICDVCVSHRHGEPTTDKVDHASEAILALLDDGKQHHVTDVYQLALSKAQIDRALEYLAQEELIHIDGSMICK
jgi:ATP-dependent DNA helicase RecQ